MNKIKKKVVVIGGSGFIGRALLDELNKRYSKKFQILNIARNKSADITTNTKIIKSTKELKTALLHFTPSIIIDLSGSYKSNNYMKLHDSNLKIPLMVLDLLKKKFIKAEYIVASSASVYDTAFSNKPKNEQSKLSSDSFYGISKISLENICKLYANRHGISIKIARIFNVLGPYQPNILFPAVAINDLLKLKEKQIQNMDHKHYLGLNFMRDFLDVRDVASALCLLMNNSLPGLSIYNICSGKGIYLSEIYQKAYELIFSKNINYINSKKLKENNPSVYGSNKKFCSAFEWSPTISLQSSIQDQINIIKKIN